MPDQTPEKVRLPPRWFIRLAWITHRRLYRWTGGRLVTVDLAGGPRQVSGQAAHGGERERLWARWRRIDKNLDADAARRSRQTAVVVLEPPVAGGPPREAGLLTSLARTRSVR
jgi:hypothetical protein